MTRNPRAMKAKIRTAIPPRPSSTVDQDSSLEDRLPTAVPQHKESGLNPTAAAVLAVAVHAVVFVAAALLEPEPSNDQVAWQWIGDLAALGYLAALGTAFATLSASHRSLKASLIAGGIGLLVVVGCPVSGHHAVAGWWYATLGLFIAATLTPAVLLRRARRR